jgi:tartrate dehydrogenase/decarboxylase/D-malate dehydrogenase
MSGSYSGVGGRIHRGTPHGAAGRASSPSTASSAPPLRLRARRGAPRKLLASAAKSNALTHSMVMWDEVVEIVARDYPAVEYRKYHVDAPATRMITHRRRWT